MTSTKAIEKEYLDEIIQESGYLYPKTFEDGSVACLMPLMFTCAIVSELDRHGYGDRWCYKSIEDAKAALDAWDGKDGTEPEGWHRHPSTGRRRENGEEYVNF